MIRLSIFLAVYIVLHASPSFAQKESKSIVQEKSMEQELEVQIANDLNRIQTFFIIANNGIFGSRKMDPTEEQEEAFRALQQDREMIQSQLSDAMKSKNISERLTKLSEIKSSMDDLEKRLTSDILLPHQVEALKQEEFTQLLQRFKGDFARVVENFYGKKFGMTPDQKRRWDELRKKQEKKKRELNQEYNQKLRKVEEEARQELGQIFTSKQIKMIRELSGIDLTKKIVAEDQ